MKPCAWPRITRVEIDRLNLRPWTGFSGDFIPALSLHQPYASWVCDGSKPIETRGYPTKFRGDVLICASKAVKISGMPVGVALGIVDLYDCRPMRKADEALARCEIYPNAHAWMLRNLRVITPAPIVVGKQGFFFVDTRTQDEWFDADGRGMSVTARDFKEAA